LLSTMSSVLSSLSFFIENHTTLILAIAIVDSKHKNLKRKEKKRTKYCTHITCKQHKETILIETY